MFYPDSQWNVWMTTQNRLPVLKGTLDLLVLRALSWTPMHGFEIVSWLARAANQSLELDDSALYQAVYRLEARGLLEADWGVTENNRRARYYKLTTAGRTYRRAEGRASSRGPDVIRDGIRRAFNLALRRKDQWEREVEEEIKLHLTLRAEQLMAHGATPTDAYHQAVRKFGALDDSRARLLEAARHRERQMKRIELFDEIRQDTLFALRTLSRQKGWTAITILTF